MLMSRVRRFTKPDGTDPHIMDGRIIITALPQFITLNHSDPILVDGLDLQDSTIRQFSITFVGRIGEDTSADLRAFLDGLMGEARDSTGTLVSNGFLGMRNLRFYLYDDRYWLVRHEGSHLMFPYPGVRTTFTTMELYLRVMDPYLYDEAGLKYRCW